MDTLEERLKNVRHNITRTDNIFCEHCGFVQKEEYLKLQDETNQICSGYKCWIR